MPGNPKRHQVRKQFPPRVPNDVWRTLTAPQRLELTWGFSLDDVLAIQSIPVHEADLHTKNLKIRIFEGFLKLHRDIWTGRERSNASAELIAKLTTALTPPQPDMPGRAEIEAEPQQAECNKPATRQKSS